MVSWSFEEQSWSPSLPWKVEVLSTLHGVLVWMRVEAIPAKWEGLPIMSVNIARVCSVPCPHEPAHGCILWLHSHLGELLLQADCGFSCSHVKKLSGFSRKAMRIKGKLSRGQVFSG